MFFLNESNENFVQMYVVEGFDYMEINFKKKKL